MKNQSKKENTVSISILWHVFRNEVGELYLPQKVIERIRLRLKEKINDKE